MLHIKLLIHKSFLSLTKKNQTTLDSRYTSLGSSKGSTLIIVEMRISMSNLVTNQNHVIGVDGR
jgi:hypothetical protein